MSYIAQYIMKVGSYYVYFLLIILLYIFIIQDFNSSFDVF